MKFLLCVLLLPLVTTSRLTPRENRELRRICGKHFFGSDDSDDYRFKSYGGRRVRSNEYPWLVTVLSGDNDSASWCSGVVISNRHVLTAAHCIVKVYRYEVWKNGTMEECHEHRTMKEQTWIKDRKECPEPTGADSCKRHVAKVRTVHPEYNDCKNVNDLAILEMSSDLQQNHLVPICMPRPWEKLARVLQAAGSGNIQPSEQGFRRDGYNVVNMTLAIENSDRFRDRIITNTAEDASMCKGDSGGPLFQSDVHGIHTLVGILSSTTGCKDEKDENKAEPPFIHLFADVRKYLDWICKVTGVCDPSFDNETCEDRALSKLERAIELLKLLNRQLTYPR